MKLSTIALVFASLSVQSYAAVLQETFSDPSTLGTEWIPSKATKQGEERQRYDGTWSVEPATVLNGASEDDYGLVLKAAAKHHAISRVLPSVVKFDQGEPFVLQYEVKLQNGLECGGAYVKLLSQDDSFKPESFHDQTPYTIMFGPDKCGPTNKVHFIFRHKDLYSGEIQEKHLKNAPQAVTNSKSSTLYTLIVRPDNSFDLRVNNESLFAGSLFNDFEPAVNPPKEIDDPNDFKPRDWVDDATIVDESARKPDDWDEDEPLQIKDVKARKPKGWLDSEPSEIPDPKARKPSDWDDEEDGEWVAPLIPNPKCTIGCGPWEAPMIRNPAYRGKWYPPNIPNPKYKGIWKPRKVRNPYFVEDFHPNHFTPVGAIGLELWTLQSDILFDNIYVGHSEEEAAAFAEATWATKHAKEKELEEAQKAQEEEERKLKEEEAKKASEKAAKKASKNVEVDNEEEESSFIDLVKSFSFVEAFQKFPYYSLAASISLGLGLAYIIAMFLSRFVSSEESQDEPVEEEGEEIETQEIKLEKEEVDQETRQRVQVEEINE